MAYRYGFPASSLPLASLQRPVNMASRVWMWHPVRMTTWGKASLAGVPQRSDGGDDHLREDVRSHVLNTAVRLLLDGDGLTVGLGHLGFEGIIKEADVPRTTAYRVWPRKERFLEDLLRRLADVTSPCTDSVFDDMSIEAAFAELHRRMDDLDDPLGRRATLVEMCRVGSERQHNVIISSPEWRTYLALIATMQSVDDDLANDLCSRIRKVESVGAEKVANTYQTILKLLGFKSRIQPLTDLVFLGSASLYGTLIMTSTRHEFSEARSGIDPFNTGSQADWSLPAIAYTSTIIGVLEEDPEYDLENAINQLRSSPR